MPDRFRISYVALQIDMKGADAWQIVHRPPMCAQTDIVVSQ